MFGFWKKAVLRNNIKLVHQNFIAASAYELLEKEGGLEFGLENGFTFASVCERTRFISGTLDEDGALSLELAEESLELNKFLRRYYDNTASHYVQSFDEAHQPVLGWPRYIEDRLNYIKENG